VGRGSQRGGYEKKGEKKKLMRGITRSSQMEVREWGGLDGGGVTEWGRRKKERIREPKRRRV